MGWWDIPIMAVILLAVFWWHRHLLRGYRVKSLINLALVLGGPPLLVWSIRGYISRLFLYLLWCVGIFVWVLLEPDPDD